eukprot:CAMPEP_0176005810 /NCGR_PEP_ID=MMETSP0120_2-20121206/2398_1 /TAXON_ID=160619 /ORGANISM="Kryptoperidinium foliaceum, Strain CCMP 1326" /LENGTH=354 /DNA_ID=CAMNT_0017338529 /DNA_START=150 /DNA_END=1211 /DNA_ORIENTATION=-
MRRFLAALRPSLQQHAASVTTHRSVVSRIQPPCVQPWPFTHRSSSSSVNNPGSGEQKESTIRLSKLLSQHATNLAISRNAAEVMIRKGEVTVAGNVVRSPHLLLDWNDLTQSGSVVIKVQGKGVVALETNAKDLKRPIVYAVHKLPGEMVTEHDPQGRPSMIQRLIQGGVGRISKSRQIHLKPIGRLDVPTEGLILMTNDGDYAREMELPRNQIHRVYKARVHGRLTPSKLERIRRGGIQWNGIQYGPMKVSVERSRGMKWRSSANPTNTWVQITSSEGKNRQIRNVFEALGATVTRLIRIQYGDYTLQTIPPGMAIEVPFKPLAKQKAKGPLMSRKPKRPGRGRVDQAPDVKW